MFCFSDHLSRHLREADWRVRKYKIANFLRNEKCELSAIWEGRSSSEKWRILRILGWVQPVCRFIAKNVLLPESRPVGPSRALADIIGCQCACPLALCQSIKPVAWSWRGDLADWQVWPCKALAWRFGGRFPGVTMKNHGTVVSRHGELLSDGNAWPSEGTTRSPCYNSWPSTHLRCTGKLHACLRYSWQQASQFGHFSTRIENRRCRKKEVFHQVWASNWYRPIVSVARTASWLQPEFDSALCLAKPARVGPFLQSILPEPCFPELQASFPVLDKDSYKTLSLRWSHSRHFLTVQAKCFVLRMESFRALQKHTDEGRKD